MFRSIVLFTLSYAYSDSAHTLMTLRAVRETLGLTQSELDRRAGQPRGTVFALETGRNQNPSLAIAVAVTHALQRAGAKGITAEALFVPDGQVAP